MPEDWHSIDGADLLLRLRVQPRASREGFGGTHAGRLRARVSAPPVEGAANERLVELLAERLQVPRSAIRVIRGEKGRDKDVRISGAASRRAGIVALLCDPER